MLTGENGILNRAREAKEKTEDAKTEEQAKMEEAQEIMEAENNKYIRNDELEENNYLKTFITEWTVNAGDTIVLPIYQKQDADEERGEKETYFKYDFQVDYGDGTVLQVKSYDDANKAHTYTEAGTYSVKIDGVCESFSTYNVADSKDKITKLVQWGVVKAKHYDFGECINLEGEIPLPAKNSFLYVESFRMLFYKCEKITGTIPRDLFKYATNVVTMANIFNTTTGITGEIPPELFKNCTNVTNFRFSFAGTNLSGEIPESLFKYNKEAKNFNGTFAECNNLYGILPKKIFENNDKITTIKTFLYRANNVSVEEIYISSKNLIDVEETGFVNRNNGNIRIYVPKDSQTETTLKGCFSGNTNVIIEHN